ncbi:MAG: C4-type zinc ribbon domain-containing protein [Planctomycetota bacterium]|nr:C4-type zinc ribbon domain-containing protein [Planctomycetota bacterium]
MGPMNIALVGLYRADQRLREAQSRLDAVSKNVRVQQRKVDELGERHRLAQTNLKEHQSQANQQDLDLKSREEKIERLRGQQSNAKTNREYQTFLVEINTEKAEKAKTEELMLKEMEHVEKYQAEVKEIHAALEEEQTRLKQLQAEIGEQVKTLNVEIESLRPLREMASAKVTARARDAFDRLADRFEGEAMSALAKPDRRREEYACTACNMDLVTDIYNKLHSRDELVFCPSCHRILYIPDELPIELAVNKVKEKKEPRVKTSNLKAGINRQTAATDILKTIAIEEDPAPTEADGSAPGADSTSGDSNAAETEHASTSADVPQS